MRELTMDDILATQRDLVRAASLARVVSAFAQEAIAEPSDDPVERVGARIAVADTLGMLVRDAEAAAARLNDLLVAGAT